MKTDPTITGRRRVLLANPRGFCAGVRRAISAVEDAIQLFGPPVYVRRAIVHNSAVVERLEKLGAIFVQELDQVPEGSVTILSAHGSARSVKADSTLRGLRLVDAICPLVAKVHAEVDGWYRAGRHILLIGHPGHPEIIGTLGQVPPGSISLVSTREDVAALGLPCNAAVAYAVQTTFSTREAAAIIAAIGERFADLAGPRASDICYATTNRQDAVSALAAQCELMLVVGDAMSSNARRLVETALASGCPDARLVSNGADLPRAAVQSVCTIGLSAAASTPESAISGVSDALVALGFEIIETPGHREDVRFRPVAFSQLD